MWGAIGVLIMQGRVEGDVGRSPQDGDWAEMAARAMGIELRIAGPSEVTQGSLRAKTLRIFLDLGAATQSPRQAAEEEGFFYIGIDTREWVWSLQTQAWIRNVVLDYTLYNPMQLWDIVMHEGGENGHRLEGLRRTGQTLGVPSIPHLCDNESGQLKERMQLQTQWAPRGIHQ